MCYRIAEIFPYRAETENTKINTEYSDTVSISATKLSSLQVVKNRFGKQ